MSKPRIGVITAPIGNAGCIPLSNLIDILNSISDHPYLITGNIGYEVFKDDHRLLNVYEIKHETAPNTVTRIIRHISCQLNISYNILRLLNVDVWIFFIGGESLLLPMLTAKALKKKLILALAGFPAKGGQIQNDPLWKLWGPLSKINLLLSNYIIIYSEEIIVERNLNNYKHKCFVAHEHFLDLEKFKINKKIYERDNLIGYIGTLVELKGVLNFAEAIPKIISQRDNLEFLLVGKGHLKEHLSMYISEMSLNNIVKLCGWIPHNNLPSHMNELKILVLPSYTEGLPNVMIEAMACGAVILATSVGAIPDVIKDGETGFLMENNSPECIAANVIRALEHSDLEGIARRARALVEREFTFEKAVERWREVLEEVGDDER